MLLVLNLIQLLRLEHLDHVTHNPGARLRKWEALDGGQTFEKVEVRLIPCSPCQYRPGFRPCLPSPAGLHTNSPGRWKICIYISTRTRPMS